MRRYSKLYLQFLKQYIKILIEYRADFIFGLVGFILVQFSGVVFIQLIFRSIPALSGWTFHEVLFIYGFAQIPRGIDHVFTDNLWLLSGRILLEGGFDKYLLRPINPLFHLLSERFQPDGFGEIIIGSILVGYSGVYLGMEITPGKGILFLTAVLFASIIYTAIKLAVSSDISDEHIYEIPHDHLPQCDSGASDFCDSLCLHRILSRSLFSREGYICSRHSYDCSCEYHQHSGCISDLAEGPYQIRKFRILRKDNYWNGHSGLNL
ncbi:ABC transporter permease [Proteiniclasticum ruminis]|uniref:ABC transporter permease n=1 Tax=Proteiniclasticum ruminis TaxID=398199 RepID=UPI003F8E2D9D